MALLPKPRLVWNRTLSALFRELTRDLVSRIGVKRGKSKPLSMILRIEDLPGKDRRETSVETYRTGAVERPVLSTFRTKRSRAITASGFYRNRTNAYNILIKLSPLESLDEARLREASYVERMLVRLSQVKGASLVKIVEDFPDSPKSYGPGIEYEIEKGFAKGKNFKDIFLREGTVVFTVSCSAPNNGWSWYEVLKIVESQRSKIISVQSG